MKVKCLIALAWVVLFTLTLPAQTTFMLGSTPGGHYPRVQILGMVEEDSQTEFLSVIITAANGDPIDPKDVRLLIESDEEEPRRLTYSHGYLRSYLLPPAFGASKNQPSETVIEYASPWNRPRPKRLVLSAPFGTVAIVASRRPIIRAKP